MHMQCADLMRMHREIANLMHMHHANLTIALKTSAFLHSSHVTSKSLKTLWMFPPLDPCQLVECFSHPTSMPTLLMSLHSRHDCMKDIMRYKYQHSLASEILLEPEFIKSSTVETASSKLATSTTL